MILTRASEYAIRCVLFLATRDQDEVVSRRTISREMGIPTQFLSKIAQRLARVGLIEIRQGAKGGYLLARRPEDISLLEVLPSKKQDGPHSSYYTTLPGPLCLFLL